MEKRLIKFVFLICIAVFTHSADALSTTPDKSAYHNLIFQGSAAEIWNKLQPLSSAQLVLLQKQENNPDRKQWLQLALLSKKYSNSSALLAKALIAWHEQNPIHPGNQLIPSQDALLRLTSLTPPKQIAVLLPLSGAYANSGQKIREGIIKSYYEDLSEANKPRIHFYDTSPSTNINQLYQKAIADGADFVIGPLVKSNVEQLISLGNFPIPTLSLNYTDTKHQPLPSHFFEFGLMPDDEALQIASRARLDKHNNAILIAPNNDWGKHLAALFTARWQALGGEIKQPWYFTASHTFSQEIANLMGTKFDRNSKETSKRRQDVDVIFLFAQSQEARAIVPLLRFHGANDLTIYANSTVYAGKPNQEINVDLNGVVVCDIPWKKFAAAPINNDILGNRLMAVGKDAYLLAEVLPRLQQLPEFPIYAATGALFLTNEQQIRRHLPCAPITNGNV